MEGEEALAENSSEDNSVKTATNKAEAIKTESVPKGETVPEAAAEGKEEIPLFEEENLDEAEKTETEAVEAVPESDTEKVVELETPAAPAEAAEEALNQEMGTGSEPEQEAELEAGIEPETQMETEQESKDEPVADQKTETEQAAVPSPDQLHELLHVPTDAVAEWPQEKVDTHVNHLLGHVADRSKRWVPGICLGVSVVAALIVLFFLHTLLNRVDYLASMVTGILMIVSFDIPKKVMLGLTGIVSVAYIIGQLFIMGPRGYSFSIVNVFMLIVMICLLLTCSNFSREIFKYHKVKRRVKEVVTVANGSDDGDTAEEAVEASEVKESVVAPEPEETVKAVVDGEEVEEISDIQEINED